MLEDTIVAIATPVGYGGIGVVRLSGTNALAILQQHTTKIRYPAWKLVHTKCIDPISNNIIDDILAVYMPAPNTFTGEDVVEMHCHGSPVVLNLLVESCVRHGARCAERGEFSKRALLNNRLSLAQTEAIIEIIHAKDTVAMRMAQERLSGKLSEIIEPLHQQIDVIRMQLYVLLDFPEDDVETIDYETIEATLREIETKIARLLQYYKRAKPWQKGIQIVLVGSVNAGKSSLLNAIVGKNRAIVSSIAGTTRDFIEEQITLDGIPTSIIDTAGLRETHDIIERQGIEAVEALLQTADIILFVIDISRDTLTFEEVALLERIQQKRCILVFNKEDMSEGKVVQTCEQFVCEKRRVSAQQNIGIDALLQDIKHLCTEGFSGEELLSICVPNTRQARALECAQDEIIALIHAMRSQETTIEIISTSLDMIAKRLEETVGYTVTEDLINTIFEHFCIGK